MNINIKLLSQILFITAVIQLFQGCASSQLNISPAEEISQSVDIHNIKNQSDYKKLDGYYAHVKTVNMNQEYEGFIFDADAENFKVMIRNGNIVAIPGKRIVEITFWKKGSIGKSIAKNTLAGAALGIVFGATGDTGYIGQGAASGLGAIIGGSAGVIAGASSKKHRQTIIIGGETTHYANNLDLLKSYSLVSISKKP